MTTTPKPTSAESTNALYSEKFRRVRKPGPGRAAEVMSCNPATANLIVFGQNGGTTFAVTRQINNDLLELMASEVFTANRVASISHLIARGLHWYMTHPQKMGWNIDYMEGLCGITPGETIPAMSVPKTDPGGKVLHVHGTQSRTGSHTISLAFPQNLWSLVQRYVSTDRGQKVIRPNAQIWINHLIARGLWVYAQPEFKGAMVQYDDSNFGVSDWPAWVKIDEPGPHIRIPPPAEE